MLTSLVALNHLDWANIRLAPTLAQTLTAKLADKLYLYSDSLINLRLYSSFASYIWLNVLISIVASISKRFQGRLNLLSHFFRRIELTNYCQNLFHAANFIIFETPYDKSTGILVLEFIANGTGRWHTIRVNLLELTTKTTDKCSFQLFTNLFCYVRVT